MIRSAPIRPGRALALCELCVLAFGLLSAATCIAHDARPLSVTILGEGSGAYRVVVRIPPTVDARNVPRIVWPESCDVRATDEQPGRLVGTSLVRCPDGLAGRTLEIRYPLYNPAITTLFRLRADNGVTRTAVLPPNEPVWVVPVEPTTLSVARDYGVLGFTHIWEGPDHLLFVAGLMLLAASLRRILLAVTGFTVAHSITLSLAALGFVHAPVDLVEALIALSILFLAGEIAHRHSGSFSRRFPVVLAFVFGLLHGFGFASALGEVGLPTAELATGLVFFNVGVEIGQFAFIAAVLVIVYAARQSLAPESRPERSAISARVSLVGAYILGVPAAFWSVERCLSAFGG